MNLKRKISKTGTSFALLGIVTFSFWAQASSGTSLMQTAPVKAPGEYEIKLQNDIIFNDGGGINISPHFVTGLIEHFVDVDAYFGTGKTDFQIGAMGKYNLLPDLPEQMGLSFLGGLSYLKNSKDAKSYNWGLLSFGVLTSKKINVDFGALSPYAAFQAETLFRTEESSFLMNLQLGAYWQIRNTAPWSFYSEFGISLRKSLYMLAIGASYPL
jgi:hypothetical protein